MKIKHLIPYVKHTAHTTQIMGRDSVRHSWILVTRFHKRVWTVTVHRPDRDYAGEPSTVTRQASAGYIKINRGLECHICHWNTDQLTVRVGQSDQMIYDAHKTVHQATEFLQKESAQ